MIRRLRHLTVRSPHHRGLSGRPNISADVARQHRQKKRAKAAGQVLAAVACVILGAVLAAAFMLGVAGW